MFLQSIIFHDMQTFGEIEPLILEFSKQTNILIGPKGGGKSTLIELIVNLERFQMPQTVADALAEHDLEFVKARYFGGDVITASQLKKLKKQETKRLKDKYSEWHDYIWQNDKIKTELTSNSEVVKKKQQYLTNLIEKNPQVNKIVDKVEQFYALLALFLRRFQRPRNWNFVFRLTSKDSEKNLITDLNYNNDQFMTKLASDQRKLREYHEAVHEFKTKSNHLVDSITNDTFHADFNDYEALKIEINKTTNFEQLFAYLRSFEKKLANTNVMARAFQSAFRKTKSDILNQAQSNLRLDNESQSALDHVISLTEAMTDIIQFFNNELKKDFVINFSPTDLSIFDNLLEYRVQSLITLKKEVILKVLKKLIQSNQKTLDNPREWFSKIIEKPDNLKQPTKQELLKTLVKVFLDEEDHNEAIIKIYANNKEYETMSAGEKSIFGMSYKLMHNNSDHLYLDQPEDNIDNHTIALELLSKIQQQEEKKQTFIVTHNANIGILTSPEKVIVCNLASNKPYQTGHLQEPKNNNETIESLTAAFYLEGGTNQLQKRYHIIIEQGD